MKTVTARGGRGKPCPDHILTVGLPPGLRAHTYPGKAPELPAARFPRGSGTAGPAGPASGRPLSPRLLNKEKERGLDTAMRSSECQSRRSGFTLHAARCLCLLAGRGAPGLGGPPLLLLSREGPTFTYGRAAKRKGRMKDLDTSQCFHAKQFTWKVGEGQAPGEAGGSEPACLPGHPTRSLR